MFDRNALQFDSVFPVPLFRYRWPDSEPLNESLRAAIFAREQESPGQVRSNVGGWQSTEDFQKWTGAAGQTLLSRIGEMVNQATSLLLLPQSNVPAFRWKMAIWANVNRARQFNQMHFHPGSTWSGTYYVDSGDAPPPGNTSAGCISFMNPNLAASMSFFTSILPQTLVVPPEAGLMILFPSYLPHTVYPYEGERPRISVAFNVLKDPYP